MTEKMSSINSTNEQFETTTEQAVFRISRKLERKPLIGDKIGNNTGSAVATNVDSGAMGGSGSSSGRTPETGVLQMPADDTDSVNTGDSFERAVTRPTSGRTLKTSDGVFAPVALSQFSSLLFLRVGYLVGNGGLLSSLGLLAGAYSILVFTVLSICAISTNGAVEGGGAYFMISRTLGPEMGGAIGFVFYIANVFSCALYTSGCLEGLLQGISIAMYPSNDTLDLVNNGTMPTAVELNTWEVYLISVGINLLLLCLCLVGANMFAKCTNLFFYTVSAIALLVVVALLSQQNIRVPYARSNHLPNMTRHYGNFTGPSIATGRSNLFPHYSMDYTNGEMITLFSLFGVMFSGVTGIMAGANLSGELRNPGYSIPRGTLLALLFTFLVYVVLFVATAFTTSTDVLLNNYVFMGCICFWQPLIYVGIVLATMCASLSNMIGASRILHAIAEDHVFGPVFNFLFLNYKCPTACSDCLTKNQFLGPLLFTFALSACVLGIGDMNSIAPYTSVFFLLSYAMVNLSCIMLVWASAPNFRPQFKHFNMATCTVGLITTLGMMIKLNTKAAFACLALFALLLICLYFYHLKYPSAEIQWGSVAQAVLFHTVRKYLLKLDFRREHVKFWRPHLLLLVSNPRSACPLIDTVNDLKKSGIYILGHVKVTDGAPRDLSDEYNRWQELVDHLKVKAFVSVTESSSLRAGALQMVRVSGLGALKPNTVLLGFKDTTQPIDFLTMEASRYHMRSIAFPSNWHPLQVYGSASFADGALASNMSDISSGFPLSSSTSEEDSSVTSLNGKSSSDFGERISTREYVALLRDILHTGKNLALCRNFHHLDKDIIVRRRTHQSYIDVWPINFLCPERSTVEDTTSLFTLQLGTILNMVKFWRKNTGFRVFLMVPHEWTPDFLELQQRKVKETLASVRMNAKIEAVPWVLPTAAETKTKMSAGSEEKSVGLASGHTPTPIVDLGTKESHAPHTCLNLSSGDDDRGFSSSTRSTVSSVEDTDTQLERMTGRYLTSVNRMIRNHSKDAAVTFLSIPPPPSSKDKSDMYLDALSRLTVDVGPCVMVHGLSKVTTTML